MGKINTKPTKNKKLFITSEKTDSNIRKLKEELQTSTKPTWSGTENGSMPKIRIEFQTRG